MKTKEDLRAEFKNEKGRTYWAEGCDYGSYNDEYVNWLHDIILKQVNGVETSHDKALHKHDVSNSVCQHDYVYKILHDHTAADVCTKCGNIKKQTDC